MNFPLYIAKRYVYSKSNNNAINIITGIASMGIIVGAMALFVVLSVFSGLREFSLSFSNDFDPDLKATPVKGKSFFISQNQETSLKKIEGIVSYSKIIEERVLFYFNEKEQVSYLKGVDENFIIVNPIETKLFNGQWLKPNTYQVVVGYGISQKLSLGLFDFNNPFEVFVPRPGKATIENPEEAFNKLALIPVGIYAVSEELDSKYVFADLALSQELLEFKKTQITGIEFKTDPNSNESEIKTSIEKILNKTVIVKNRAQLNATLYKMLNLENIVVYLIFTLVIIIALFNLIGALIMMILDKKLNLKTLFNIGTEIDDLRKIFLFQGTLLSVFGGIVGLFFGIVIVIIQQQFNLVMITDTLAYPVIFSFTNVVIVLATIILLGVLASFIASNSVTKKLLE